MFRALNAIAPRTFSTSSSNTYVAAVCNELGKPLQLSARSQPPLTSRQVRVAIDYAAINFADILSVAGQYQVKSSLPFVPGCEYTGRVSEVGSDVSNTVVGDRVIGFINGGAFAEEIVAEDFFYPVDNGLPAAEAASLLTSYGTAYMSLVHYGRIRSREVVVVTAAAGALGLATVDLAANVFGSQVIGVCGGAEKCNLVKTYGARETIDYNCDNVRERIKQITQGKGIDIFVDMVGGKVFEDCLRSMAFDGRVLTLGYAGGQIPKIPANLLLVKNISVQGVFFGNHMIKRPELFNDSVSAVLKLWREKQIRPHVGKVFTLKECAFIYTLRKPDQSSNYVDWLANNGCHIRKVFIGQGSLVNEAFQYISSRNSVGKVLLQCRET